MKKKKIDGARVKIKIIKSKPEKSVKSEKPAKQIKQKTSTPIRVGGMALSGGVMMRSAHFLAVAFDDGNKIDVKGRRLKSVRLRHTIFTWPFVRGVVMMVEAFVAAIASYSFASRNITRDVLLR